MKHMNNDFIKTLNQEQIACLLKAKPADWTTNEEHREYVMGFRRPYRNPNNIQLPNGEYIDIDPDTVHFCTGYTDKNGNFMWEEDDVITEQGDEAKITFLHRSYYVKIKDHNYKKPNILLSAFAQNNSYATSLTLVDVNEKQTNEKPTEDTCPRERPIEEYNMSLRQRHMLSKNKTNGQNIAKDDVTPTGETKTVSQPKEQNVVKTAFQTVSCQIGDVLHGIHKTPIAPFHYGIGIYTCTVEHFYLDENNNKKVSLRLQNGHTLLVDAKDINTKFFKSTAEIHAYLRNNN